MINTLKTRLAATAVIVLSVAGTGLMIAIPAQAATSAISHISGVDTTNDGETADDQGVEDGTNDGETADDQGAEKGSSDAATTDTKGVEDGTNDGETADDSGN